MLPVKLFYKFLGPQFGGAFQQNHKVLYSRSPYWDGKKFNNAEKTTMDVNIQSMPAMLREMNRGRQLRSPRRPLPVIPFAVADFIGADERPRFIWFGHSVLLLRIGGKNLLIDPMFGPDASPIAPFKTRRFSQNMLDIIEHLPTLDAILLTHDHYDHLDLESIKRLKGKTGNWFVALGVGRHLEQWGIPTTAITEFDWWQQLEFRGIEITATPARHFGGRGPFDRAKSFWCGWVFKSQEHAVYWSGDGGYGEHFKEVGERLGPFDWAFMECGQYNPRWHQIHMYPEEAVKAAHDARAKVATPVHWGGFSLAVHPWKEPVERFTAEAERTGYNVYMPRIGEVVKVGFSSDNSFWWRELE